MAPESTERFSNRVANYIQYRPHYPAAILDCLRTHCQLAQHSVVADIGSGTGMLTELFLRNGNVVYGVEPNREMREAGEQMLSGYPLFHSVTATAEQSSLPDASMDFISVGQAFHWFDRAKARVEFARITRPHGWVVLVWNDRRESNTPFAQEYEQLLQKFGTDYEQVRHRHVDKESLDRFMGAPLQTCTYENFQHFDFDGLRGRLLSSSYTPEAGHPNHEPLMQALLKVFDEHQVNGHVTFEYDTNVHFGRFP